MTEAENVTKLKNEYIRLRDLSEANPDDWSIANAANAAYKTFNDADRLQLNHEELFKMTEEEINDWEEAFVELLAHVKLTDGHKITAIFEHKRMIEALRKALKFKEYVHSRLDEAGVPADPTPEAGCRVEGRLTWLLNK